MKITSSKFGRYQGRDVTKFSITNDHGVGISVLNFAGIWQSYTVPSAKGPVNLLLSADNIDDYLEAGYCIAQVIGPVANRIAGAQFVINGKDYALTPNEGDNLIHGGLRSWKEQFWAVATRETEHCGQIILNRRFSPVDDGFPGNRDIHVVYSLYDDDSVSIDFYGQTDAKTLFNPTNHTYWNLADADQGTIENQVLQINSDYHLEVNKSKIPTGRLVANRGAYDFSRPQRLGDALKVMEKTPEKGFDDYFVVTPSNTFDQLPIATMSDPASGRQVKVFSDRNSLVVFSSDGMPDNFHLNRPSKPWVALALEPQSLTDAIHHPDFGDIILRPLEPKHYQMRYEVTY